MSWHEFELQPGPVEFGARDTILDPDDDGLSVGEQLDAIGRREGYRPRHAAPAVKRRRWLL